MGIKSFIADCEGLKLTAEERDFFREENPWGFIVFARNIETPEQLKALTDDMRDCVGRDNVPILVDQEGGRVRRMRPPHWQDYCNGRVLGQVYLDSPQNGLRAAWLHARLMAADMYASGITVDCLPVLDVPVEGAHDVIGDRAYATDPKVVAAMGRSASEGLVAGGVLPVIKHIPGHGRAGVDSHHELPVVDAGLDLLMEADFAPFKALCDLPMAMTAHVIYSQLDADNPATTSGKIIADIIRDHMGFDGLLMSDDITMQALSGDYSQRTQRAFAAGCDVVLHCNGNMEERRIVAANSPLLSGTALARAGRVGELFQPPEAADLGELRSELDQLTGSIAVA